MKNLLAAALCLICVNLAAYPRVDSLTPVVEFRTSYFLPESKLLQEIYGNGGVNYQITGTVPLQLFCLEEKGINIWWGVDYFNQSGRSQLEHTPSKITIVPLTLGLKYIFPRGMTRPYLGLGMKYWIVDVRNRTPYVIKHISDNGIGGILETGVLILLSRHWNLDLFTSYSYKKFGPTPHHKPSYIQTTSLEVGGWNFGGGLGFKW